MATLNRDNEVKRVKEIKDLYKNSRNKNISNSTHFNSNSGTLNFNNFKSGHGSSSTLAINDNSNNRSNTLFAEFRKELEKSKEIIKIEVEKSKQLREKYLELRRKKGPKFKILSTENKKCEDDLDSVVNINTNNNPLMKSEKIKQSDDTPIIIESQLFKTGLTYVPTKSKSPLEILSPISMPILRNPNHKNTYNPSKSRNSLSNAINQNFNTIEKETLPENIKVLYNLEQFLAPPKVNISLESKKQSTNNIKINQLNSNHHNSPNLSDLNNINPSGRVKSFKVEYDPHWYERQGLPDPNLKPKIVNNLDFQSSTIGDSIKVILENIQFYKMSYLNNPSLVHVFQALDSPKQMRLNKLLEECCGLMLEISNNILVDFSQYLEKFVSIQPPRPDKMMAKIVKNEEKAFQINVNLFNEITAFLKSCFEVYGTLVKQVDDMIIPYKDFIKIHQFLSRIRMNLSDLIFSAKNYIKNFNFDHKLIDKYSKSKSRTITEEDEEEDRKKGSLSRNKMNKSVHSNSNSNAKSTEMRKSNLEAKIRSQYTFKINEYNERIRRLNAILNKKEQESESSFEKKKKKLGQALIKTDGLNSEIINKLLKYFPKDIKNLIVSERIINRHKERTGDSD